MGITNLKLLISFEEEKFEKNQKIFFRFFLQKIFSLQKKLTKKKKIAKKILWGFMNLATLDNVLLHTLNHI
jgi:hypothetical protein